MTVTPEDDTTRSEQKVGLFFKPSPFMRWTLVPVLVAFAIGMPYLDARKTTGSTLLVAGLSTLSLLYAVALLAPARARWASRVAAAMVFLFYVWYAVIEWFFSSDPVTLLEPRGNASPVNALLGLFVIGVPALAYAVRGFRRGRPK